MRTLSNHTSVPDNTSQYITITSSTAHAPPALTRHVERGVAAMRIIDVPWTMDPSESTPRRGRAAAAAAGSAVRSRCPPPARHSPSRPTSRCSIGHSAVHTPNKKVEPAAATNKRRHAACLVSDTARNVSNKAHARLLRCLHKELNDDVVRGGGWAGHGVRPACR